MDQTSDRNVLQSVDTALQLIDLFETTARLSLSDISEKLGVGKSTAFRLCHTLEQRGYLVRHSDMRYGLGVRFLSLGAIASDRQELASYLRPLLIHLMELTEETVHLVVWADSYRVVLLEHVLGRGSVRVVSDVRSPRYPHSTSTGMTLLASKPDSFISEYLSRVPLNPQTPQAFSRPEQIWAAIEQVRKDGYFLNNQTYEIGLVSIAVPIYNSANTAICSISVSGPDSRILPRKEQILKALKETAEKASHLPL